MNGSWLVLCILFCAITAQPTALNFTVGDQLVYNLNALLDTKGFDVTTNTRTGGSFGNMTSTVVIQCTDEDEYSYMFVMNMWNTAVGVGQSDDLSSADPQLLGDWLGDDMYFQQNKTGEIVEIWYTDGDSEYFIEVKIGAINAFQTHIVPVSSTQVYEESDPVGTHLSNFIGESGQEQSLQVTKTFTQNDVSVFPDANLRPENILLAAQTVTTVHSEGYILSSSVSQSVNLVNIVEDTSKSAQEGDSTTTALNVQFSSVGSLDIEYTQDSSEKPLKTSFNKKELLSNSEYKHGSLLEVASQLINSKRFQGKRHHQRFHGNIDHFISEFITTTDSRKISRMIPRLARAVSHHDNLDAFQSRMEGLLQDAKIRNKYFSVLARIAHRKGEKLALQYLNSQDENIQVEMIRHLQFMKRPSETMVNALVKLAKKDDSMAVKQASLVAVGSLAKGRSHGCSQRIIEFLGDFLEKPNLQPEVLTYVIHALGNAGIKNVPTKYATLLRKFVENSSRTVRKAATMTLEKLQVKIAWEESNFPFNKTFNYDAKLGGATVNADFDVELFAGSNFDCKQTDFNYEALASATATIDMWSYSKQAFIAEVVYGQANNQVVGDEVLVQLFDDVIYHQTLPTIDCLQHTYEIYQTSPGFSVSYFIWQMVIPIVFTASADLNFELSWGYDVCVNQLDAMVELVPQADIVISGDAVVDLLIIQAGIELDGSFNTQLNPQLYVHGTECQVGIDVERVSQPMNIDLTAYYAWKDCKYWIFDCHWGQHNQDTLYSWDYPSVDQVIYNQSWQIQV